MTRLDPSKVSGNASVLRAIANDLANLHTAIDELITETESAVDLPALESEAP